MFNRTNVKTVFDELDDEAIKVEEPQPVESTTTAPAETTEDTETTETTETTDTAETVDAAPRRTRVLRRTLAATAAVVILAALGAGAYFTWQYKQLADTAAASAAALSVAREYAVTLTSVSSSGIDENFAQVLDGATGDFKDMYSQSATQLRQILIENKAEARGTVTDAAVKSATKTKVDVLLFVDQSITNTANPTPRIDRNRVSMTMELVDGHWLASKVDVY